MNKVINLAILFSISICFASDPPQINDLLVEYDETLDSTTVSTVSPRVILGRFGPRDDIKLAPDQSVFLVRTANDDAGYFIRVYTRNGEVLSSWEYRELEDINYRDIYFSTQFHQFIFFDELATTLYLVNYLDKSISSVEYLNANAVIPDGVIDGYPSFNGNKFYVIFSGDRNMAITGTGGQIVCIDIASNQIEWTQDFSNYFQNGEQYIYNMISSSSSEGAISLAWTVFFNPDDKINHYHSRTYLLNGRGEVLYEYSNLRPLFETIGYNINHHEVYLECNTGAYLGKLIINTTTGQITYHNNDEGRYNQW